MLTTSGMLTARNPSSMHVEYLPSTHIWSPGCIYRLPVHVGAYGAVEAVGIPAPTARPGTVSLLAYLAPSIEYLPLRSHRRHAWNKSGNRAEHTFCEEVVKSLLCITAPFVLSCTIPIPGCPYQIPGIRVCCCGALGARGSQDMDRTRPLSECWTRASNDYVAPTAI